MGAGCGSGVLLSAALLVISAPENGINKIKIRIISTVAIFLRVILTPLLAAQSGLHSVTQGCLDIYPLIIFISRFFTFVPFSDTVTSLSISFMLGTA